MYNWLHAWRDSIGWHYEEFVCLMFLGGMISMVSEVSWGLGKTKGR